MDTFALKRAFLFIKTACLVCVQAQLSGPHNNINIGTCSI